MMSARTPDGIFTIAGEPLPDATGIIPTKFTGQGCLPLIAKERLSGSEQFRYSEFLDIHQRINVCLGS